MSNYSYLSTDEIILINILNTMYNDNYRQIEQLQESNTRIMGSIINILSSVLNNRSRTRQGTNTNTNCSMGCSQFIINRGSDFSSSNLRLNYSSSDKKIAGSISNSSAADSLVILNCLAISSINSLSEISKFLKKYNILRCILVLFS